MNHQELLYDDMMLTQNISGDKAFLMGDEPCEFDCAVFGLLAQIYWQSVGELAQILKGASHR